MHFPGQETVNEYSVNHISDRRVNLPGEEMANVDAESNDVPQDGGVRRGKKRTAREMYVPAVSTILCHSTNTHYWPYEDRVPVTGYMHLDRPSRDLHWIASYLNSSWYV